MSLARCVCVMYHYVRDRADGIEADIRGLSASAFEAQLDALCTVMTPIDWPTFNAWRAGDINLKSPSFLLTFDDALSDHADVVFPILEARNLCGTFFVQTRAISEQRMDTAHQIHLLLCKIGATALTHRVTQWLNDHPNERLANVTVDDDEARRIYHYESPQRATLKYLLSCVLPLDIREQLVDQLFAEFVGDTQAYAARWYLDWDQLALMQRRGHTIGGHSHRHVPYARLSKQEQRRDMTQCASILSERLGLAQKPFSYPYGSCHEAIAQCCADAGFVNGFTTQEDWVDARSDAHHLGRVDTIHIDSLLEREFQCMQV